MLWVADLSSAAVGFGRDAQPTAGNHDEYRIRIGGNRIGSLNFEPIDRADGFGSINRWIDRLVGGRQEVLEGFGYVWWRKTEGCGGTGHRLELH